MTPITTEAAPAAIGPYAQAIRADDLIFTSGQLPLTLSVPRDRSADRAGLRQPRGRAAWAGTRLDHVVKATVFVTTSATSRS